MRIIYNPKGLVLKTTNVDNNDIVFDGNSQLIRAQGVIYKGTDSFLEVISESISIPLSTDWTNTNINTSKLVTGTYIVLISINTSGFVETYYTGILTWFSGTPTILQEDEIPLHTIGKSFNNLIYLRTYNLANKSVQLLIACTLAYVDNVSITFKFKKMI